VLLRLRYQDQICPFALQASEKDTSGLIVDLTERELPTENKKKAKKASKTSQKSGMADAERAKHIDHWRNNMKKSNKNPSKSMSPWLWRRR